LIQPAFYSRWVFLVFSCSAWGAVSNPGDELPDERQVRITYDTVYSMPEEDVELKLDAYIPEGGGPFPAILVVHGGAWRTGNKLQLAGAARRFAERGMAAFAISYRLAPKHKFPAQIHDCKAAVRWIRSHATEYGVDPHRIGAYGYSAGGHLVSLLGATTPADGLEGDAKEEQRDTRIQCVCAGGAPCDFREIPADNRVLAYWLGDVRAAVPERYRRASPITFVRPDNPPMFFFHGSRDELVKSTDAERMVQTLQSEGVSAEFYAVEGAGHIGTAWNLQALDRSCDFFCKYLQTSSKP
jgi:acetyl esterase/lipase